MGRASHPDTIAALRDAPSGSMRAALPTDVRRGSGTMVAVEIAARDDASIVAAIVAGDQRAEAELYRRYAPLLARTIERLLRSSQDAQDVLQDTFVIALEEVAHLREPSAIRGWLLQVAVRQVHRRFRRRKLRRLLGFEDPEPDARLDQLAAEGTSPDVVAELALLDRALVRAKTEDRMAWMLRRIEGYALDEIATSCGCSLATAKRRIAAVDAIVAEHMELKGLIDE